MKRSRAKKPAKKNSLEIPGFPGLEYPAIAASDELIDRRRKAGLPLDNFFPPKTLRGRRSELDDRQIANRRDRLIQILAAAWGEIGWELQHLGKAQEVAAVLQPLAAEREQCLEPFLRFSCIAVDEKRMFALRDEIKELNEPWRKAAEQERRAIESLETIKRGLLQAQPSNLEKINAECARLEEQAKNATEQHASFARTSNDLQKELAPLEAAFAQAQLLDFIEDERYSFTPINLAAAMAGMPYMRWRQSIDRCRRHPSQGARGLWYEVFEFIARVIGKVGQKTESAITHACIVAIPDFSGPDYIREFLGDNWFFLRRAIQLTCAECTPLQRVPFRIMATFSKQFRSQSGEDAALAQMEKLPVRAKKGTAQS